MKLQIENDNILLIMNLAIEQAMLAGSDTLPNPRVGAVIFDDKMQVLGIGYHRKYGHDHAEVSAIKDAKSKGNDIKGSSMCVTLEPCNHEDKTPPCTKAIIESKISNVFIGVKDNNCSVTGCGADVLIKNGINVKTGILEDKCLSINPGFHKYNTTSLPFVHLKTAISLNGKVGNGKWFTSPESKIKVHEFRNNSDFLITGVGTIESDDPSFNTRISDKTIPNTLGILDTKLRLLDRYLNKDLNCFKVGNKIKIITVSDDCDNLMKLDNAGVEYIVCRENNGYIDIPFLLNLLAKDYGVREIHVEAGPILSSSFLTLDKKYLDKITFIISPKWFEDSVANLFTKESERFPYIKINDVEKHGDTVMLTGEL